MVLHEIPGVSSGFLTNQSIEELSLVDVQQVFPFEKGCMTRHMQCEVDSLESEFNPRVPLEITICRNGASSKMRIGSWVPLVHDPLGSLAVAGSTLRPPFSGCWEPQTH